MGGSQSSTTTQLASKMVTDVMSKSIMNCASKSDVSQELTVKGSGNDLSGNTLKQNAKIDISCVQTAKNMNELKQAIKDAITQAAESSGVGITSAIGASSSDANLFISNDVEVNVTNETVAKIVNESNQKQVISIDGDKNTVKDNKLEQTEDYVAKNCQSIVNNLKSVQNLDRAIQNKSKAETKDPIAEWIGSIFSGLGSLWFIFIIIGVVVIGGGIIWLLKSGSMSDDGIGMYRNLDYENGYDDQQKNTQYLNMFQNYR